MRERPIPFHPLGARKIVGTHGISASSDPAPAVRCRIDHRRRSAASHCITDEEYWPERRNWKMFLEWFEIMVSSETFDMEMGEIEREDA